MKNLADLADFLAKLPKRNAFLAKRSETYEAKQSETKRNFFFVVSRNWTETKRNCFCFAKFCFEEKLFLKRNWDTLATRDHEIFLMFGSGNAGYVVKKSEYNVVPEWQNNAGYVVKKSEYNVVPAWQNNAGYVVKKSEYHVVPACQINVKLCKLKPLKK